MHRQLAKALDFDADAISHTEMLEQVLRYKLLAEEATKNRVAISELQTSMKDLQR